MNGMIKQKQENMILAGSCFGLYTSIWGTHFAKTKWSVDLFFAGSSVAPYSSYGLIHPSNGGVSHYTYNSATASIMLFKCEKRIKRIVSTIPRRSPLHAFSCTGCKISHEAEGLMVKVRVGICMQFPFHSAFRQLYLLIILQVYDFS